MTPTGEDMDAPVIPAPDVLCDCGANLYTSAAVLAAAQAARMEERERCALVCEAQGCMSSTLDGQSFYIAAGQCAAAIRSGDATRAAAPAVLGEAPAMAEFMRLLDAYAAACANQVHTWHARTAYAAACDSADAARAALVAHVAALAAGEVPNPCKLTECRGKPRCEPCLAMDRTYPAATPSGASAAAGEAVASPAVRESQGVHLGVPENQTVPPEGFRMVPDWKGYARLGTGQYTIDHTPGPPDPELGAELIICIATEADKAGNRQVGEERDNDPNAGPVMPEQMAIRIGFVSAAGLDALEAQLRHLRRENFPESLREVPYD